MKNINKISVGVAFALLVAMVFTTIAKAESSCTQKVKYATDTSYYHPKNEQDRIESLKACRFDSDDINDLYSYDSYLWIYAHMYTNCNEYRFYDLKKIADKLNEGIEARYGQFFNQGFIATDDISNPTIKQLVCKCNQNDFNEFLKIHIDDSWSYSYNEKNHTAKYSKTYPNSIQHEIVYAADYKILRATNIFMK